MAPLRPLFGLTDDPLDSLNSRTLFEIKCLVCDLGGKPPQRAGIIAGPDVPRCRSKYRFFELSRPRSLTADIVLALHKGKIAAFNRCTRAALDGEDGPGHMNFMNFRRMPCAGHTLFGGGFFRHLRRDFLAESSATLSTGLMMRSICAARASQACAFS